jgi:poly(hydroxyalkanoate) depolymerase family esterase
MGAQTRDKPYDAGTREFLSGVAMSLEMDGDATHRLFLPAARTGRRVPLLVMLHGCQQNAADFAAATRMNAVAQSEGFAVLYPQQSTRANPLRCWNWFLPLTLRLEARAIARLIVRIGRAHAIDRERVYVAGMSAGAVMARTLAVRHAQLFAACAVHSGLMYGAAATAMQGMAAMRSGSTAAPAVTGAAAVAAMGLRPRLVPMLVMHGTADAVVASRNADQLVEQFLVMDALIHRRAAPLHPASERSVDYAGRQCRIVDYSRDGRVLLRRCLIEGLGHAWSGGDAAYEFSDAHPPSASELLWDFVSGHGRPKAGRVNLRAWWRRLRVALRD